MELIEIIKHTIFLIVLVGIGIFTLSFSIYKIRTRNKLEVILDTVSAAKVIPLSNNASQISVKNIYQNDPRKRTSEKFIVVNDLNMNENSRYSVKKHNRNYYRLQSINNTAMYTLKFE
ncbi:MAG: hypothetical protein R6W68_10790 [Ignavibacteriaceae bacterium]